MYDPLWHRSEAKTRLYADEKHLKKVIGSQWSVASIWEDYRLDIPTARAEEAKEADFRHLQTLLLNELTELKRKYPKRIKRIVVDQARKQQKNRYSYVIGFGKDGLHFYEKLFGWNTTSTKFHRGFDYLAKAGPIYSELRYQLSGLDNDLRMYSSRVDLKFIQDARQMYATTQKKLDYWFAKGKAQETQSQGPAALKKTLKLRRRLKNGPATSADASESHNGSLSASRQRDTQLPHPPRSSRTFALSAA